NQIPKLALNNNINLHDKFMIKLKSVGHLKMMEILNENDIEKLSFHYQQFLNIFQNELYSDIKFKPTSISLKDVDRLIEVYVLLNKKSWMKAVKDVERILFQEPNYIHSLNYWEQDALDKNQILLNFNYFSTTTTCFMLRYLMTFQRQELKRKFKDGPIRILCGKSQFSNKTRLSGWKEDYESPKKKSIENELNKWKIQIRLEQDKNNPAVQCLNEEDVQLFFETVPPELNDLLIFDFKNVVIFDHENKNNNPYVVIYLLEKTVENRSVFTDLQIFALCLFFNEWQFNKYL
ncbi:hypothetical protein RFI_32691, partial [Reticulomyxa filosa]